jgi:hypothetical protein
MRWDELPPLPRRLVDVSVQRSGLNEAQNPAPDFCDLPEVQQQVVRGRGFRRQRGCAWKKVWIHVGALDHVFSRLDKAFTLEGFSSTIPEVRAAYHKVCMDIKVLVGVVPFQDGETEPVGAVPLGDHYLTRASMH